MWYVHVNQHKIRKNIHADEIEPPVAVLRGRSGKPEYGSSVRLPAGSIIHYDPHKPILKCGARLVIECPTEPEIIK